MRLATLLLALLLLSATAATAQQSRWAHLGPDGKLQYAQSPNGDRIIDFSYAGYRGGGIALPHVENKRTVAPSGADDTAAIQAALDDLAKLPLDKDGHRGAVELAPGTFHCAKTLEIHASGIVLRGAGFDPQKGTTIELTGEPHLGITLSGKLEVKPLGSPASITDAYVPSGTRIVHVSDAKAFHPGDEVQITKPATDTWVRFMGMSGLTRDGRDEHWVGTDLRVLRHVTAVQDNALTLDVPLTDDIDSKFLEGGHAPIARVQATGQIAETAIESLRITAPSRVINFGVDPEFDGIEMKDAVDSWMRDVHLEDTTNSIRIESGTERLTIESVDVLQRKAVTSSAKNFDFSVNGSQILFDRVTAHSDRAFFFATQARQQGPVVLLHARFTGDGAIEPHQRWSTGLLVDSCEVPNGAIHLVNRGIMGSGHGWTIGWSVLWNNQASEIMVQQPPGTANWSIGDRGVQAGRPMPNGPGGRNAPDLPRGLVESPGKPVEPASLYLEQLRERLGPDALKAIDY